jgi:hypothetical protein
LSWRENKLSETRKCRQCAVKKPIKEAYYRGISWFCSIDHAVEFAKTKAANDAKKARKQANAEFDRKFYEQDPKTREKAARASCHKYIRERDKYNGCICCGRPLGKNFDAGHFLESGNNSFLRYHEDNIHAQSVHCNQFKGGDSGDYEANLRLKIGYDRVDWLKANKGSGKDANGNLLKRDADDYKAIEAYYKEKLKELEKRA